MSSSDALNAINVSLESGFQRRVGHMLYEQSVVTIDAATPPAGELAVAKLFLGQGGDDVGITTSYCRALVTVQGVIDGLEANDWDHLAFTDAQLETQVDALWPTFAKAYE